MLFNASIQYRRLLLLPLPSSMASSLSIYIYGFILSLSLSRSSLFCRFCFSFSCFVVRRVSAHARKQKPGRTADRIECIRRTDKTNSSTLILALNSLGLFFLACSLLAGQMHAFMRGRSAWTRYNENLWGENGTKKLTIEHSGACRQDISSVANCK